MFRHQERPNEANSQGSNSTNNDDLRIVLLGKTGSGKSCSGNTILGRMCFETDCSPESTTVKSSMCYSKIDGQQVAVIDTPNLFDTRSKEDQVANCLHRCIYFSDPGPHIFLVVVAVGRFTKEEKYAMKMIQQIFGKAADRYSMVLFTHGDRLEDTIEDFISKSQGLKELVSRCYDQYHVFNNKLKDNKAQVTELLQKIRTIVQSNGGSHYTNAMFQEAQRAIEVEKKRIQKEKDEEMHKVKEELERQYERKIQILMQEIKETPQQHLDEEEKQHSQKEKEDVMCKVRQLEIDFQLMKERIENIEEIIGQKTQDEKERDRKRRQESCSNL